MSSYILSRANRFYAALESTYGVAAAISDTDRLIGRRLQAHQVIAPSTRRDKTGVRTYAASGVPGLRTTAFEFATFFTSSATAPVPCFAPVLQGALGSAAERFSGIAVSTMPSATEIRTAVPHGMKAGDAVAYAGEIRFVVAVPDVSTVTLNAPLSNNILGGSVLGAVACYRLGTTLPSITFFDYWDPNSAVSRLITGAAVNELQFSIAGDTTDLTFTGTAADLLDSATFAQGAAGLNAFPLEPPLTGFEYSPIGAQTGQAWIGNSTAQFFTLSTAQIAINNNLELRKRDMVASPAQGIVPGPREIIVEFTLFTQDDAQTTALYAIAKQQGSVAVQLQVGTSSGEIMALYAPSVTPELPLFNDKTERLQWQFSKCIARGASNDELFIAFA